MAAQNGRFVEHDDLIAVIQALEPFELDGVVLLREVHATGALPVDRDRVAAAAAQLVQYTTTCDNVGSRLKSLMPIAAADPALVEGYPL